jgi:hypothetical protein
MYHSKLGKPKVSDVNNWELNPDISNQYAKAYHADIDHFFMKVVPLKQYNFKMKYFYGETAWQDSQRYAHDIYFKIMVEADPWTTVKETD